MGRTSILMVLGFSAIFLLSGKNMSNVAVQSLNNSINYYEHSQLNTIAVAGANLACSQLFQNSAWRTGFSDLSFGGGIINVTVTDISGSKVKIVSTGIYQSITAQVIVIMVPSSFAKFAFYGGVHASAAQWETGDTVGGPSHTQGKLKTFGSPVFMGKTTALSGLTMSGPRPPDPVFMGGFESGISVAQPAVTSYANIYTVANTGGHAQTSGDLFIKFHADGTVEWKTSAADAYTTTSLSSFAPNGIIAIDKGILHVEGTVPGRVTLASIRTSGSTGGTVEVMNSLVLKTDPRSHSNSEDFLGIVSYGDITIKDNNATEFNLQGSFYSAIGGIAVEHGTTRPAGMLRLYGGLMVDQLYATSNGGSGSSRRGYNLRTDFDTRLTDVANAPDYFPVTSSFEILSWLE